MSINSDLDGLEGHMTELLGDAERVFQYPPDEPYQGLYPYLYLVDLEYVYGFLPGGVRARANPDAEPNMYAIHYVDRLVSLSGATLRDTMRAHNDFIEQIFQFYTVVANQCIPGSYLVGGKLKYTANQDGPYDVPAGVPVILSRVVITTRQNIRTAIR